MNLSRITLEPFNSLTWQSPLACMGIKWFDVEQGIIEWPLNGQFRDAVTVVLASQTAVIGNQW